MLQSVYVFDPTVSDTQSGVRGVGRYLQILKENFPGWVFTNKLPPTSYNLQPIFINPFFNFLAPPLLMKRIAQKQIAIIHDLIPLKYPEHFPSGIKGKLNVFLNKLSLKNYDRIITDSEASKKDIIKILGIENNKITVIYPCLPKIFTEKNQKSKIKNPCNKTLQGKQNYNSKFKTSYFSLLTSHFCLYVGDATWNKNLVNLAKAIKILNVPCVFVGEIFKQAAGGTGERAPDDAQRSEHRREGNPGQNLPRLTHPWQKELREFFQVIENDKRFILKGFVTDEELIQLYQQARVNILPSRDEGFGFSYLEAASQKCPSVLSDIPALHGISNEKALFADPSDPHDIANAIGELYWNSNKRNLMGIKAFERSNFFSSSQLKKSFLDILKNL